MRLTINAFFVLLLMFSCTNPKPIFFDQTDIQYAPDSALSEFIFEQELNNKYISENIYGRFFGNNIFLYFPPGTSLTDLHPTFVTADPGTKVFLGDRRLTAGQDTMDFSGTVQCILQSPNGTPSYYNIFCRHDLSWPGEINDDFLKLLSDANLETHIKKLSSIPTRLNWTAGNTEAAEYIEKIMQSYGYKTERQNFYKDEKRNENIICFLKPSVLEKNPVILSAHYDSINHHHKLDKAPGADDNASGVAFLLETARLFATKKTKPIVFVFFDAEEQGLWGSEYFVDSMEESGETCALNFTVDMIGGFKGQKSDLMSVMEYQESLPVDVNQSSRALGSELTSFLSRYGDLQIKREYLECSDFIPFMQHHIPSVGLIEGHFRTNPNYHNVNDTFENINWDYYVRACRGALAFVMYKTR